MLFFLQRDSHSAGCTRQTPPNRVSADSPSRILLEGMYWNLFDLAHSGRINSSSGRSNSRIYFGRSLVGCGIFFFLRLLAALVCKR